MDSVRVPDALKGCDHAALQAYVTASIIQFTSDPTFASLLGQTPESIKNATLGLLQQPQQQRQQPSVPPPPPPPLLLPQVATLPTPELSSPLLHQAPAIATNTSIDFILAFRHDCLNVGCSDLRCQLCVHAQARRCSKNFCSKYLVGDALKAECGAPIRVEALDKFTAQPLPSTALQGVKLDAVLLNGRSVQAIKESNGGHISARDIEHTAIPTNAGRFLLDTIISTHHHTEKARDYEPQNIDADSTPEMHLNEHTHQHHHSPDGRAILQFRGSEANISGFMVTGSSEGILSGQRPQFILLIRALDAITGIPLPSVPPLLSEGFVVATSRVRTAAKKTIPHWNDDVSKLNSVGKATVEKLKDLRQAAIDGGCPDLQLPLARVHTVAEFRQLADWAVQDKEITNKVKKILKLTKGWDAARDHAAMAVQDDCCLRAWWVPPPSSNFNVDKKKENGDEDGEGKGQQQQREALNNNNDKKCALVYAADKGVPLLTQGPIAILEISSSSSPQHAQQQGAHIDTMAPAAGGNAVLRPLLKQNSGNGAVGWALDDFSQYGVGALPNTHRPSTGGGNGRLGAFPSSSIANSLIPPSVQASAPPFPSSENILSSHAAWYEPHHPGWMSFPLPLTVDFLRSHLLTQPHQPIALSSQLMSMCCQYYGRGIQAVHAAVQEQRQQHQDSLVNASALAQIREQQPSLQKQPPLLLPSLSLPRIPPPPPPPLLQSQGLTQAPVSEHNLPSFSSILQSFPSLPPPEILSRLLSSLPSFDSEQAAAAAAIATGAGASTDQKEDGQPAPQNNNITTNTTNTTTFLGRAISHSASDLLASMDALFPAAGGSGNSSSLFRGLTPDWGKLNSLSPQEWQQLLQLTEVSPPAAPATGNENNIGGGGDVELPSRPPSNETDAAAASLDLFPPLKRSVSAAKSIFGGKLLEQNGPSPFETDGSPSRLSLLPSPPPSLPASRQGQQELMLNEEPSLRLMLPVGDLGVDPLPVGIVPSAAKKRQSDGVEREKALAEVESEKGQKEAEEKEEEGNKAPKQRRLSLP